MERCGDVGEVWQYGVQPVGGIGGRDYGGSGKLKVYGANPRPNGR